MITTVLSEARCRKNSISLATTLACFFRRNVIRKENHFLSGWLFIQRSLPIRNEHIHVSFLKKPKSSSGLVVYSFENPAKNFSSKVPKKLWNWNFFHWNNFLQIFLWTKIMKFWQPFWKLFAQIPKSYEFIIFFSSFFSQIFSQNSGKPFLQA